MWAGAAKSPADSGSADELKNKLEADIQKWSRLVKEKNIRIAP